METVNNTVPLRNMTNAVNLPVGGKAASSPIQPTVNQQSVVAASNMQPLAQMNTGSCPEYGPEILEHYLLREKTLIRNPTYLTNQPEVTERMRCILMDWMVDVHIKFRLRAETFFLSCDIVDRYLCNNQVTRARLQLIGVCATLLAAKHEEIWPPEVKDCIYIAANTYSREDILEAEREVANDLQFRLAVPTPYPILSFLMDALEAPPKLRFTAVMFLEAWVIDYGSLKHAPSTAAFASVILAHLTCKPTEQCWPRLLEQLTRVEFSAIEPCATEMLNVAKNFLGPNTKYQATKRKFSNAKYGEVATQVLPDQVPEQL